MCSAKLLIPLDLTRLLVQFTIFSTKNKGLQRIPAIYCGDCYYGDYCSGSHARVYPKYHG